MRSLTQFWSRRRYDSSFRRDRARPPADPSIAEVNALLELGRAQVRSKLVRGFGGKTACALAQDTRAARFAAAAVGACLRSEIPH